MMRAGVPVRMVSPKRTHDSQELFDGVRSLHDPKSAMVIGKLCAMNLSTPWSEPSTIRVRLRALVDLRQHEQRQEELCFGRLEAVLARHWPEFGQWMNVREQQSALHLLEAFPNPVRVGRESERAATLLKSASRAQLSRESIVGVIAGAQKTIGVPMVEEEEELVSELAKQLLSSHRRTNGIEQKIRELGIGDEVFARLSSWMGGYSAAVIITRVDPRLYSSARQLEKACGLNLREKSSGEYNGRLTITKRGSGLARQVLYLFSLRMIKESPTVRAWYKRRRGYTEESKKRAVVAVMRKLVRALYHVARGNTFEPTKLFDVSRLDVDSETPASPTATPEQAAATLKKAVTPRTTPRAMARGCKRAGRSAVNASA
jgi:hypothetical protein